MNTTGEVLNNHLASFGKGDLAGILADYAPTAILFTPDGPLVGIDAIRPLFENMLAEFGRPGASFDLKHQSIQGEVAYIWWTAETSANQYDLGTDTFVVRGGKIVAQSFAARIVPKS